MSLRWLMHDITERKRVEEQVRTLNAELECRVRHRTEELETALADVSYLHEVATRLSGSLELEPLLEEILAVVARFVGAERGALLLCDGGSDELALLASIGLTEAFTGQLERIPRDARPWWPVLGTGAPVIVSDVEVEAVSEELRTAMRAGGVRAIFAVPLIDRRGDFLGTIAEFFAESHWPPGRQVDLIELYARQAADSIEAARLATSNASPPDARRNSWRRWRTSCAIRWRRSSRPRKPCDRVRSRPRCSTRCADCCCGRRGR